MNYEEISKTLYNAHFKGLNNKKYVYEIDDEYEDWQTALVQFNSFLHRGDKAMWSYFIVAQYNNTEISGNDKDKPANLKTAELCKKLKDLTKLTGTLIKKHKVDFLLIQNTKSTVLNS
ncbi:hypothetical protein ACTFIR_000296 [Dictyostelium discoideum]